MRVFDCGNGEYIPLGHIYAVYTSTDTPHILLNFKSADGVEDILSVRYESYEQRDAAFRDAFDVVGKTRT